MTALLLAVTAHGAFMGLCVTMAAAFVLLCGVIWLLRPVPVETIPEAPASTQRALAAAPIRMVLPAAAGSSVARRTPGRPVRGCPQCGGEMATGQALGVDVGECPACGTVATVRLGAA